MVPPTWSKPRAHPTAGQIAHFRGLAARVAGYGVGAMKPV
jgi:hypothetical protein